MDRYLALIWARDDGEAAAQARVLTAAMRGRSDWRCHARSPGLEVWAPHHSSLKVRPFAHDRGFLLGDLFASPGQAPLSFTHLIATLPADPRAAARRLTRDTWGRYLALFASGPFGPGLLRDPCGALEVLVWRRGALTLVASDIEDAPRGLLPPHLALDWSAIAAILDDPAAGDTEIALRGITAVQPGLLRFPASPAQDQVVWSPAQIVRQGGESRSGDSLADTLDACVLALVGGYDRSLVEISGGLDSAIVAASVVRNGLSPQVAQWVNYYADRREGDERSYARAVANGLGTPLTEVAKALQPLTATDFDELAQGARPPVNASDPPRDRETALRMTATGARALVSGQGGDAVFFQQPSAAVALDHYRALGLRRFLRTGLVEAARLSRRSIWAVLADGWRAAKSSGETASRLALPQGLQRSPRSYRHPWVSEAADLPPGRRMQVAGIANSHLYRLDSRRRRAGDMVYPLLAQPVVELCLRTPLHELTLGGRDRGLARAVFADRLPSSVALRRSKGDLGSFYGRMIAASLDYLRPHLLDGVLCETGLLDRAGLCELLTPEQLIWRGGASAILQAAALESWIRYWQGRVPDAPGAGRPRP